MIAIIISLIIAGVFFYFMMNGYKRIKKMKIPWNIIKANYVQQNFEHFHKFLNKQIDPTEYLEFSNKVGDFYDIKGYDLQTIEAFFVENATVLINLASHLESEELRERYTRNMENLVNYLQSRNVPSFNKGYLEAYQGFFINARNPLESEVQFTLKQVSAMIEELKIDPKVFPVF